MFTNAAGRSLWFAAERPPDRFVVRAQMQVLFRAGLRVRATPVRLRAGPEPVALEKQVVVARPEAARKQLPLPV
jgi:hypothetical protein